MNCLNCHKVTKNKNKYCDECIDIYRLDAELNVELEYIQTKVQCNSCTYFKDNSCFLNPPIFDEKTWKRPPVFKDDVCSKHTPL